MADWTEKYRPRSLTEVRGNDKAVKQLREWADTWSDHREAAVLHGSPGVGKTSAAHALAADMGWEVVELNASDQRTADDIDRFAGRAAQNASLAGSIAGGGGDGGLGSTGDRGRQLVLLDEADNLHGNVDRGGARAITDLVKSANQPVVLVANEYYEMSRGLRKATREIEFRDVSARSIVPVLRDLCRKEGIEFESAALQRIADANSGDLRGAVKDLQATAQGRDRITVDDVVTGDRDRTVGIFEFLDDVLKEADPQSALQSAYAADETPDDLTGWVEHNLLSVYDGVEATRAYEFLANADVWLGRVRATQNYSYWRYVTDNTAAGVAAARDGTKGGWTRYSRPQFWGSSNKTADAVVRKVADRGGVSMATARRAILPFLSAMTAYCKPRELTVRMAAVYDLDESEVAFVTGSGETTNKVESIVADAAELRTDAVVEHAGDAFRQREAGDGDDDAASGPEDRDEGDGHGDGQSTLGGTAAEDAEVDDPHEGTDGAVDAGTDGDGDGRAAVDDSTDPDAAEEAAGEGGDADDETDAADDGQSGLGDFM
jgi:replication factor C large subunit